MKKIVLIAAILLFSALNLQAQWGSFNGVITTNVIDNITTTSATAYGTIALESGDPSVTEAGFVYNTTGNPTTTGPKVAASGGPWNDSQEWTYNTAITGLTANQVYYVKAYIINTSGTAYGNQVAFATIPTLGEWGLIALGSLFALGGGYFVWRRIA